MKDDLVCEPCEPLAPAAARVARKQQKRELKHQRTLDRQLRRQTTTELWSGGLTIRTAVAPEGSAAAAKAAPAAALAAGPDAQVTTCVTSAGDGVQFVEHRVRQADLSHLQWFWGNAALRQLGTSIFDDVKEITESCSAYRAARRALADAGLRCEDCCVVVVADGGTPRTASLFVADSACPEVHSIDPEMRAVWKSPLTAGAECLGEEAASRLHCHLVRVEEWLPAFAQRLASASAPPTWSTLVIVAVHSHVRLSVYIPQLRALAPASRAVVVAIPCCLDQSLWAHRPLPAEAAAARESAENGAEKSAKTATGKGAVVDAGVAEVERKSAAGAGDGAVEVRQGTAEVVVRQPGSKRTDGGGEGKLVPLRPLLDVLDWGIHAKDRRVRVWLLQPGDATAPTWPCMPWAKPAGAESAPSPHVDSARARRRALMRAQQAETKPR